MVTKGKKQESELCRDHTNAGDPMWLSLELCQGEPGESYTVNCSAEFGGSRAGGVRLSSAVRYLR